MVCYLYKVWREAKQCYILYIDKYVLGSNLEACKGMISTQFRTVATSKEGWKGMRSGGDQQRDLQLYI